MCRKQPTPVDIIDNQNINMLERMIFYELWMMTRNEDGKISFISGNKHFNVEIKRGQVIAKVSKIAKDLEIDVKKVRKSIENIAKRYNEMEIESKPYGLLISWIGYDEKIKMDNEKDNKRRVSGEGMDNKRRASNKSVESEEIVESDKENLFNEFWVSYPNKKSKDKAKEKYIKLLNEGIEHIDIMNGVKNYLSEIDKLKKDKGFIKHPTTWLNQGCWNDEYDVMNDSDLMKIYDDIFQKTGSSKEFREKYGEETRDRIKKLAFNS